MQQDKTGTLSPFDQDLTEGKRRSKHAFQQFIDGPWHAA
jgi:hypothetical protein